MGLSNWKSRHGGDSSDEEGEEKVIDQQLVFKYAMNSNYAKIIELGISKEGITKIDSHNDQLK